MQWSPPLSPHPLPHDSLTVAGNALATASDAFQPAVLPKLDPAHTVTLYPGDCIELLRTLPDHCVQLIVTSPPYNLGKAYEKRTSIDAYYAWQQQVITECFRVLQPTGSLCWQVGNYVADGEIVPLDLLLYPIFKALKMKMRNRIIWHFGHGLHASKRFSGRHETIMWWTKSDAYYFDVDPVRVPQKYPHKKHFKGPKKGALSCNPDGKNPSDVWEIPNVKNNHVEKTIHPCQFPVELVERLVLSMTQEEDLVFDPFSGVGSTLVAALMHKRKCIGAEIEEKYVGIAKDRIQATLQGTIQTRAMHKPIYTPQFVSHHEDRI
ncbi:MAG: site-specific DNA-methyltransferase [Roseivirga sp.]